VTRISLAHPQYEKDVFLRILSFSEVGCFPTLGVLSNPKADLVDGFWNGVDHPQSPPFPMWQLPPKIGGSHVLVDVRLDGDG
jgi:hypothetical protein